MGYFLQKFGIKPFIEAEVDGKDLSDPNAQSADYTEGESTPAEPAPQEVQEAPQETPVEPEGNEPPTPPEDNEDSTDYTEQDPGDMSDEDDGNAPPTEGEEDQPVNIIKHQEEEIYDLSPEQLDVKHKELKSQFLSMYDITTSIIDRIGDASVNEENIGIIEYISDTLSRLRTMLTDYVDSIYASKSYMENFVAYNRFLAVLNGVNKLLEELDKKEDK